MDYFFLGDAELLTAFRFIGIEGAAVADSSEAVTLFRGITEGWNAEAGAVIPHPESCRVLIMTEETADWLGDLLDKWQAAGHYPLVVEIPGMNGPLPGRKTLVDSIREAIGVHV